MRIYMQSYLSEVHPIDKVHGLDVLFLLGRNCSTSQWLFQQAFAY